MGRKTRIDFARYGAFLHFAAGCLNIKGIVEAIADRAVTEKTWPSLFSPPVGLKSGGWHPSRRATASMTSSPKLGGGWSKLD